MSLGELALVLRDGSREGIREALDLQESGSGGGSVSSSLGIGVSGSLGSGGGSGLSDCTGLTGYSDLLKGSGLSNTVFAGAFLLLLLFGPGSGGCLVSLGLSGLVGPGFLLVLDGQPLGSSHSGPSLGLDPSGVLSLRLVLGHVEHVEAGGLRGGLRRALGGGLLALGNRDGGRGSRDLLVEGRDRSPGSCDLRSDGNCLLVGSRSLCLSLVDGGGSGCLACPSCASASLRDRDLSFGSGLSAC